MNEDIEESRERLAGAVREARYQLDIPRRIKRSFREQPAPWIAGAVIIGAVLMMLPRNKTVYVAGDKKGKGKLKILETGFLLGALRIAATLAKPALISFVRNRFAGGGLSPRGPSSRW